jgi:hypothetical protein
MEKFFVLRMYFRNGVKNYSGTIRQNDESNHPFDDFAKNIRRRSVKDLHQAAFHGVTRAEDWKIAQHQCNYNPCRKQFPNSWRFLRKIRLVDMSFFERMRSTKNPLDPSGSVRKSPEAFQRVIS